MRDGWKKTTLGDIAEYINGYPFKPSDLGGEGTAVIRIKQLLDPMEKVDRTTVDVPERCVLSNGDIVFSWSGTLAVRVWNRGTALLNQHLFRVVEKSGVSHEWLPLVIDHAIDDLVEKSHGTTMKHITKQTLLPHQVFLPPLVEQKRIVDVVASVDDYIGALQQQADMARTARDAVLHELLSAGGDDWTETTLGKTLEIARGGSPRPIRDFITTADDGINWIKIGDATASSKYIYHTEQKIRPEGATRSRVVKSGDFILSNSMSFGRPYIMRSDGCIHDGWLLFSKVDKYFDEDFLYNLLLSDLVQKQFDSLAAGSGVRNLNIEVVKEVIIPLPSLSTQKRIAQIANSMDDVIQSTEQAVVEAKNLRSGLLSDLLSGEHEIPASYDSLLGAA